MTYFSMHHIVSVKTTPEVVRYMPDGSTYRVLSTVYTDDKDRSFQIDAFMQDAASTTPVEDKGAPNGSL